MRIVEIHIAVHRGLVSGGLNRAAKGLDDLSQRGGGKLVLGFVLHVVHDRIIQVTAVQDMKAHGRLLLCHGHAGGIAVMIGARLDPTGGRPAVIRRKVCIRLLAPVFTAVPGADDREFHAGVFHLGPVDGTAVLRNVDPFDGDIDGAGRRRARRGLRGDHRLAPVLGDHGTVGVHPHGGGVAGRPEHIRSRRCPAVSRQRKDLAFFHEHRGFAQKQIRLIHPVGICRRRQRQKHRQDQKQGHQSFLQHFTSCFSLILRLPGYPLSVPSSCDHRQRRVFRGIME